MHRVLISSDAIHGERITLRAPDALHHLRDVLRVRVGDRLECFDGAGVRYRGEIVRSADRELIVAIRERMRDAEPALKITLGQALIKPQRLEWIVQKAVELGVERVVPLMTARSVIRPSSSGGDVRLARWERIAAEAAQQCGRATVMPIEAPQRWEEFVTTLGRYSAVLLPTLAIQATPLREALQRLGSPSSAGSPGRQPREAGGEEGAAAKLSPGESAAGLRRVPLNGPEAHSTRPRRSSRGASPPHQEATAITPWRPGVGTRRGVQEATGHPVGWGVYRLPGSTPSMGHGPSSRVNATTAESGSGHGRWTAPSTASRRLRTPPLTVDGALAPA